MSFSTRRFPKLTSREEIGGDDWGHLQGAKLDVIRHLPGVS